MTDLRSDSDAPGPAAHAPLESCAPYLWGDLDPQAEQDFERHLGTCAICLDECDRLGPLMTAFSGLTSDEAADLLAVGSAPAPVGAHTPPAATGTRTDGEPGAGPGPTADSESTADSRPTAGPESTAAGPVDAPEPVGVTDRGRPGRRPARAAGPAARGPAGHAPGRARRGRRSWLVAGGLAVVAAVSLGVSLGQRYAGGPPETGSATVNPVNAGVTVEGTGATARLSVTVSARAGRPGPVADVRATVVGLTAGVEYRLYAVATDTRTHQVARWTATAGPQDVSGEITVPVDTLAFFAVADADGTAVVSARLGGPR
ncbi:hypothetical protein [Micromonospora sp. WMMD712]|uniref:hypothetical protein n=1 Tax=Micromonospora sp. WMMD712 TaxID=3016096 RepID=UPI00249B6534|nr:hypothetical protein [Micromonospora sp. WMMD712]WFE61234.1 hypothetical protein O7633_32235 [Micromonospora sp. WMMD712]